MMFQLGRGGGRGIGVGVNGRGGSRSPSTSPQLQRRQFASQQQHNGNSALNRMVIAPDGRIIPQPTFRMQEPQTAAGVGNLSLNRNQNIPNQKNRRPTRPIGLVHPPRPATSTNLDASHNQQMNQAWPEQNDDDDDVVLVEDESVPIVNESNEFLVHENVFLVDNQEQTLELPLPSSRRPATTPERGRDVVFASRSGPRQQAGLVTRQQQQRLAIVQRGGGVGGGGNTRASSIINFGVNSQSQSINVRLPNNPRPPLPQHQQRIIQIGGNFASNPLARQNIQRQPLQMNFQRIGGNLPQLQTVGLQQQQQQQLRQQQIPQQQFRANNPRQIVPRPQQQQLSQNLFGNNSLINSSPARLPNVQRQQQRRVRAIPDSAISPGRGPEIVSLSADQIREDENFRMIQERAAAEAAAAQAVAAACRNQLQQQNAQTNASASAVSSPAATTSTSQAPKISISSKRSILSRNNNSSNNTSASTSSTPKHNLRDARSAKRVSARRGGARGAGVSAASLNTSQSQAQPAVSSQPDIVMMPVSQDQQQRMIEEENEADKDEDEEMEVDEPPVIVDRGRADSSGSSIGHQSTSTGSSSSTSRAGPIFGKVEMNKENELKIKITLSRLGANATDAAAPTSLSTSPSISVLNSTSTLAEATTSTVGVEKLPPSSSARPTPPTFSATAVSTRRSAAALSPAISSLSASAVSTSTPSAASTRSKSPVKGEAKAATKAPAATSTVASMASGVATRSKPLVASTSDPILAETVSSPGSAGVSTRSRAHSAVAASGKESSPQKPLPPAASATARESSTKSVDSSGAVKRSLLSHNIVPLLPDQGKVLATKSKALMSTAEAPAPEPTASELEPAASTAAPNPTMISQSMSKLTVGSSAPPLAAGADLPEAPDVEAQQAPAAASIAPPASPVMDNSTFEERRRNLPPLRCRRSKPPGIPIERNYSRTDPAGPSTSVRTQSRSREPIVVEGHIHLKDPKEPVCILCPDTYGDIVTVVCTQCDPPTISCSKSAREFVREHHGHVFDYNAEETFRFFEETSEQNITLRLKFFKPAPLVEGEGEPTINGTNGNVDAHSVFTCNRLKIGGGTGATRGRRRKKMG